MANQRRNTGLEAVEMLIRGRYGGEEFLVILPQADAECAHQLLDRIRVDFSQFHHR